MVIGYRLPCEGWYAAYAPEGASERRIQEAIVADISTDAYPYGASLDILWQSSDGREGWLRHMIAPRRKRG
jgi:hypothetical protein